MSELGSDVNLGMPVQDQALGITAGRMLREARELKGLAPAALAASLKISVKKIEAIESGRFDLLPDIVFTRALAFSICRNLKIDAEPILDQFPPIIALHLKSDASGMNTPFRASEEVLGSGAWHAVSRPIAILVSMLFLVASSFYLYPLVFTKKIDGETPVAALKVIYPVQMDERSVVSALPPAIVASAVNPSLKLGVPTPIIGLAATGSGTITGNIVFTSRGVSWVEVVDAKGTVLLRKTLLAGEVVAASGVRPLIVVVGKADSLDVSVAGKPFNLMGVAKDNVARFEVN